MAIGAIALGVAAVVAAHHGIDPHAVAAAGVLGWWPMHRANRQLRASVRSADRVLARAAEAERGARAAVRSSRARLAERLAWASALAGPLRAAGRSEDQVVADLATALRVSPALVRARLANPEAAEPPAALAAALATPGVTADQLVAAAGDAVTALDDALHRALDARDGAAEHVEATRARHARWVTAAATRARRAGVPVRVIAHVSGLPRDRVAALPGPRTPGRGARLAGWVARVGWRARLEPGAARTWLRVGSRLGLAGGAALLVFGAGPVATALGVGLAAVSAVVGLRAWWTPRQPRAPTTRELIRAAVRLVGPLGFVAGVWAAMTAAGPVGLLAGVGAATVSLWAWARAWNAQFIVEHRIYTTGLQTLLQKLPFLGPILEKAGFTQLLHFKLGDPGRFTQLLRLKLVFKDASAAWKARKDAWDAAKQAGAVPGGLGGRIAAVWSWAGRVGAFLGALKYNRAFTAAEPLMHPAFGPEFDFHGGLFGIGLKISAGDLGHATVLDTPTLNHAETKKNRILGVFPVIRLSLQFYVGPIRLDLFLLHFDVPGKKVEQKFDTPKLAGWRRFNIA
ncbi:hypothetical protein, partial [Pseudonocardia acaciae]|uniref:hypothetical protein n=1 Tax=Pseudonocardia acaciae TaxID=551276 RepID=UPI001B80D3DB